MVTPGMLSSSTTMMVTWEVTMGMKVRKVEVALWLMLTLQLRLWFTLSSTPLTVTV